MALISLLNQTKFKLNFCHAPFLPLSQSLLRIRYPTFPLYQGLPQKMEALYSKLYDKYNKLKSKKISEIEEIGHDQEVKFVNYATASDELIEHLKSENERLEAQLNELHSEVDLMRSSRDEYRKLLNDECQKTKELFKEVERLQNLQQQEINSILTEGNSNSVRTRKRKNGNMQLGSSGGTQVVLEDTSAGSGRKKLRLQHPVPQSDDVRLRKRNNDNVQMDSSGRTQVGSEDISTGSVRKKSCLEHVVPQTDEPNQLCPTFATNSNDNLSRDPQHDNCQDLQQANDSTRKRVSSGGCISTDIMLQNLLESLVGMKFGFVDEEKGLCLSAVHQSSGYSFSITWVSKAAEQEVELLYQVLSLGTIGGVAKEWMKEEIMFNLSMWPLFVKRVSQVIGM